MARLLHSPAGYVRAMQISATKLWIFVEGDLDLPFYSRIIKTVFHAQRCQPSYAIRQARELPWSSAGGGKKVLLQLFAYLRRRKLLKSVLGTKTTVAYFFLDKDVDELLHAKSRSPHVMYTEPYNVENYLFMYGKVPEAVAVAAELDLPQVELYFSQRNDWRQDLASAWKEWIAACVFNQHHHTGVYGFGYASKIQTSAFGPLDSVAHSRLLALIQAKALLQSSLFLDRMTKIRQYVDRVIKAGKFDRIFNGKWYADALQMELPAISGGRRHNSQDFKERLESALVQSLDFSEAWAVRLVAKLLPLAQSIP